MKLSFSVNDSFASISLCIALTAGVTQASALRAETAATTDQGRFEYLIVSQSLDRFFETLARDAGVRINVSDAVNTNMTRTFLDGNVDEILFRVAQDHELDWFKFNETYYVSARAESITRMTRLGNMDAAFALQALENTGLRLASYPVEATAEGKALTLSGPPRYLAFAEAVIENLPDRTAETKPMIIERRGTVVTQVVLP